MARVTLRKITKDYEGTPAVRGIDLAIEDKEFVVLVGPSGCGKSTTLRMIAGLEDISAGEILIGEEVVNDVPPKDRDIAMVFQNYALYPHMSVYENMSFGLRLKKVDKAEIARRVENAARILDISELLDRKPKQLSGGQRQRVAMGRAIVREPAVFLFDEPLSNLDAKLRVQMRFEIQKLHRRLSTTTLYVTHDQVEAMTLAQRMIVMNAGRAEQIGTPMEVYENPATLFVAGFIGSPAMNCLPGMVEGSGQIALNGGGTVFSTNGVAAAGRRVTAGIRPEHLIPSSAESSLAGSVEMIEQLGADSLLHVAYGGGNVIARVPHGVYPEIGTTLQLAADPAHVYLFDTETGTRII